MTISSTRVIMPPITGIASAIAIDLCSHFISLFWVLYDSCQCLFIRGPPVIVKIANKKNLKIKYTEPRPGDIINSYTYTSKAKSLLKFEPKYNQEDGLKDYFKWYNDTYGTSLGNG